MSTAAANTTTSGALADRATVALDGMRAVMAAEPRSGGPAGALMAAILRLLEQILVLLAEFRAGTLAAVPSGSAAPAAGAASATCAASAMSAARAEPGAAQLRPARSEHRGHHQPQARHRLIRSAAPSPARLRIARCASWLRNRACRARTPSRATRLSSFETPNFKKWL
jgi:hypothetical protein